MVVCLDLEREFGVIIEGHNACVVDKCRDEGQLAQLGCRGSGGAHQVRFDEAVDGRIGTEFEQGRMQVCDIGSNRRCVAGVDHTPFEGFVGAVFAPGLGNGLEFTIGGITIDTPVVGLYGTHFVEIERQ